MVAYSESFGYEDHDAALVDTEPAAKPSSPGQEASMVEHEEDVAADDEPILIPDSRPWGHDAGPHQMKDASQLAAIRQRETASLNQFLPNPTDQRRTHIGRRRVAAERRRGNNPELIEEVPDVAN
jgi:hypothetical protein